MLGSYVSFSTWVMVVNMNIEDEHALPLCYIFGCLIQDHYALIGTWSDHPGKPYNQKAYVSVRKVVPTLTSKSAEIYLSMAGAKQLVTLGLS
jgi:hypothetical protein